MKTLSLFPALLGWLMVLAQSLASVGPDYIRPTNDIPNAFATNNLGTWQLAHPSDAVPKGNWWSVFQDSQLDALESRAGTNNQDLKASLARLEQARASTRIARSEFFPSISLDPNFSRTRYSPNGELIYPSRAINDVKVPFDLSYEIDFWGRIRRSVESATRDAEARAAAFESFQLALHAEVAQEYFSWKAIEAELDTLRRTLGFRREARDLVQARFEAGAANELEFARAETELASVAADLAAIERRRAEFKNNLAVLLGAPAPTFLLDVQPLPIDVVPPSIPPGLPSDLLERRPDVAEAERDLAARNARIGVAKAAFFPTVRLTGMFGWESADTDLLFDWHSRIWSIGPSVTLPIFQGGRNRASLRRAQAAYDEGVANYRGHILTAFREVQDSLVGLHWLHVQSDAVAKVVEAARRTASLSKTRYESGFATYLEVVESERTRLAAERQLAQLAGQRLVVTVQLIKALGGGWEARAEK